MPATRTVSRNGHHNSNESSTTTRRTRRSHSIPSEASRHVVQPAKRRVKSIASNLPGWVPYAIGGLGLCALIYGLFQIESVRDFVKDSFEPVSDFLSGDEFEENEFAGRDIEDDSDYGSGDFGSSASEYLRNRL